ncbi:alpha/beta hydrolase [Actinomadura soli]|uniref:Alpha/beta hydrolase n=2 Tax=Actinomadura soli TaxID=2508997 RepID=A0A5C4JK98_9ACTN|nr:alpha/beta hydrolase [Actinomadura soli]
MFLDAFPGLEDGSPVTVEDLRRYDDDLWNSFLPDDAITESVDAGGVPALWTGTEGASPDKVLIWLHGGGYSIGSAAGRRALAAGISRQAGCRVLLPDYRLAPENRFPAAVEDAVAVLRWTTELVDPSSIVIGGDSAGGGLAVAALLSSRDEGLAPPAAAVLLSPLADFTASGESHRINKELDPFVTAEMLAGLGEAYFGDSDRRNPLISPVFGDIAGLPPLQILVGTAEALLDDSRALARSAVNAGIDVDVRFFDGMFHLWPMFASILPEGQRAIDAMSAFVRDRIET